MARYRLTPDDASNATLVEESVYDRACAKARMLSQAGTRIVVRLAGKAGRVLALYDNGREKFYTYIGGKEF